ncbi:aminotransferase class IV [Micromonospora sp. LOL_024]|uniref:aminotransferase class IV n=1 Tax=Micromonospora sp. LOL_024 TaxID=3345412 RepID=UPI003A85E0B5
MTCVEINGAPASIDAVHRAATWNYGHYTCMQVRRRRVPGLALHLRRLREASAVLFPDTVAPSDSKIIELIEHALREEQDASVRVTVLPVLSNAAGTDVMVSVSEPVPDTARAPLRVMTVPYERELPGLKHVATMGLTHRCLEARRAGFDDVLFTGRDGNLREGSVWNVAFWDGEQVIWPEAPMLAGITMQVLRLGLRELGIPEQQRRLTSGSLTEMRAAAATNSHCPAQPIAAIDETVLREPEALTTLLRRAWQEAPWDTLHAAQ